MSEGTVCGLPLPGTDNIGQPVAALVIIKTFDASSDIGVAYQIRATEGLSTVEGLGMADYATLILQESLRRRKDSDA